MSKAGLALAAVLAFLGSACGATTTRDTRVVTTDRTPSVTSATATFMTRDDGKDKGSAVTVQILEDGSRLSAEGTVAEEGFDDHSVSRPLQLSMTRPLEISHLDDARVRLRLTPDGRDTWTFDMRMNIGFSDGTQREYFWSGLRLDEGAPERVMALNSGLTRVGRRSRIHGEQTSKTDESPWILPRSCLISEKPSRPPGR